MKASRDFPYLNKIPGLERMDVSAEDFVPTRHRTLMIWALVFFVVAAASAFAAWGGMFSETADLLFILLFVLFAVLGSISLMARFVETPAS